MNDIILPLKLRLRRKNYSKCWMDGWMDGRMGVVNSTADILDASVTLI